MTVGAYVVGAVLIVGFDRLPMFALKAAITAATIVITGAVLANHENGSTYVVFYFWATVYAFSFFSLRQALGQTALMGVAFGLVLVLQRGIWQEEIARWLLAIGTTLAAGMLVRFLAGTLRHRSLHDPLTGLPNRRALLTALDEALERTRRGPARRLGRGAVPRPRRLQARQRLARPRRRRRAARAVARPPRGALRPARHCGALRRRRVRVLCAASSDEARRRSRSVERINARCRRRSRSAATSCTSRRQRRRRASPARSTATATRCCATPTPRCTRPRRAAGTARAVRRAALRRRRSSGCKTRATSCAAALDRDEFEIALPADRRAGGPAAIVGVEALVRWQHPERGLRLARRVHPDRRGQRPDRPDRALVLQRRLRAGRRAGTPSRRRARRHLGRASTCRRASCRTRAASTIVDAGARARPARADAADARDHRDAS